MISGTPSPRCGSPGRRCSGCCSCCRCSGCSTGTRRSAAGGRSGRSAGRPRGRGCRPPPPPPRGRPGWGTGGRAGVAGWQTHPPRRRRLLGLAYPLAWTALILGLAGPRWGLSDETGVAVGRDVVVVLDLSRSMLADDTAGPARWQSAKAGVLDLLDAAARRGGHRGGLVGFAAKPKLVCPLTTDYRHLPAKVGELGGGNPPA